MRIAVLTLSDRAWRGERGDDSGPAVAEMAGSLGEVIHIGILPDEREKIRGALTRFAEEGIDLVLTTGGTGLSPRDVTPEATQDIADRLVPGIPEAMRMAGLSKTPHAMLSRGVAAVKGKTLIVNLPGSPKAARECLEAVLPALVHAVAKIHGDPSECPPPPDASTPGRVDHGAGGTAPGRSTEPQPGSTPDAG